MHGSMLCASQANAWRWSLQPWSEPGGRRKRATKADQVMTVMNWSGMLHLCRVLYLECRHDIACGVHWQAHCSGASPASPQLLSHLLGRVRAGRTVLIHALLCDKKPAVIRYYSTALAPHIQYLLCRTSCMLSGAGACVDTL